MEQKLFISNRVNVTSKTSRCYGCGNIVSKGELVGFAADIDGNILESTFFCDTCATYMSKHFKQEDGCDYLGMIFDKDPEGWSLTNTRVKENNEAKKKEYEAKIRAREKTDEDFDRVSGTKIVMTPLSEKEQEEFWDRYNRGELVDIDYDGNPRQSNNQPQTAGFTSSVSREEVLLLSQQNAIIRSALISSIARKGTVSGIIGGVLGYISYNGTGTFSSDVTLWDSIFAGIVFFFTLYATFTLFGFLLKATRNYLITFILGIALLLGIGYGLVILEERFIQSVETWSPESVNTILEISGTIILSIPFVYDVFRLVRANKNKKLIDSAKNW